MQPIDYMVAMAEERIAPPANLDLATIQQQELANTFRFHISQYLTRRAADWQAKGFSETLNDWAALNARSKFWGDDQRAAFKNWEDIADPRNPLNGRQGVNERIMLRELLRRADMMVILENKLDALVRLHTPFPPAIIGGAGQPGLVHNLTPESQSGPNAGLTEVLIPAGLCHHRLRSRLHAERRPPPLSVDAIGHAHPYSGARPAVLAGVPRRAGQGRRAADHRIRLRECEQAAHSAAGLPAALSRRGGRLPVMRHGENRQAANRLY